MLAPNESLPENETTLVASAFSERASRDLGRWTPRLGADDEGLEMATGVAPDPADSGAGIGTGTAIREHLGITPTHLRRLTGTAIREHLGIVCAKEAGQNRAGESRCGAPPSPELTDLEKGGGGQAEGCVDQEQAQGCVDEEQAGGCADQDEDISWAVLLKVTSCISSGANYLVLVPLGGYLLTLGCSKWEVSAMYATLKLARALPILLLAFFPDHPVKLESIMLLLGMATAILNWLSPSSPEAVAAFLVGTGATFGNSFTGQYIQQVAQSKPHLAEWLSTWSMNSQYGVICVCVALGPVLYQYCGGWPALILATAALHALRLLVLAATTFASSPGEGATKPDIDDDEDTSPPGTVWNCPILMWAAMAVCVGVNGLASMAQTALPLYWTQYLGVSMTTVGIFDGSGYLLGMFCVGLLNTRRTRLLAVANGILTLSLAVLLFPYLYTSAIANVCFVASVTIIDVRVPGACVFLARGHQATVTNIKEFGVIFFSVVFSFLGGVLVLTSVAMCMGTAACLAGLVSAFFTFGVLKQRSRNSATKKAVQGFRFLVLGFGTNRHEMSKRAIVAWMFQMRQGRAHECIFEESARIYYTPPSSPRSPRRISSPIGNMLTGTSAHSVLM